MSLQGLPDFQNAVPGAGDQGLALFFPYEGRGACALLPDTIGVASRDDGRPDFSLQIIRQMDPNRPLAYGVLDLRLRPIFREHEALAVARAADPSATVARAVTTGGFLRFFPLAGGAAAFPEALAAPADLDWDGLETGRYVRRLTDVAASLLRQALEAEVLPIHALVETEVIGVSPRLPLGVRFDPARLLDALAAHADPGGGVPRGAILDFFRADPAALPLEVSGDVDPVDREAFAAAMTDRVRVRFGRFVPTTRPDDASCLALATAAEVGSGSFAWDLSEPVAAPRPVTARLDPLATARQLVRDAGVGAVVRTADVPPLSTGTVTVTVAANLSARRPGVLELGVTLAAPPNPPVRPGAINESVLFIPPADAGAIPLRFSPAEPARYTYAGFAVVADSSGVRRLDAAPTPHDGEALLLGIDRFPLAFVPVAASPQLLGLAAVRGVCRYTPAPPDTPGPRAPADPVADARQEEVAFGLDADHPAAAVALPGGASGMTLRFLAVPYDGAAPLELGPMPARGSRLDLTSFPGYGPQTVRIDCEFGEGDIDAGTGGGAGTAEAPAGVIAAGDGGGVLAIDLLPEGRPDVAGEVVTLHFTPDAPSRSWTYLARDPFHNGYRWREYRGPGEPPAAWSDVLFPATPLRLRAGACTGVIPGGVA